MIAPDQVRAARALLGWSRDRLAREAGVSARTLADVESGVRQPQRATMTVIRLVLENAGVEFIAGGVRRKS